MISIILPCYNNFDLTIQCIEYIRKNTPLGATIILVDDGSTDKTSHIEDVCSFEILIRNETNIGFGPSVNKGIAKANEDHACKMDKYVCVFNNDLLVAKNWSEPLIKILNDNKEYGMVSGTTMSYQKNMITVDEFIERDSNGEIESYIESIPYQLKPWSKELPWLFRKSVFDTIGTFDEQFVPAQYEDTDIQIRMAQAGIMYGKINTSISYHLVSKTQAISNPKWGRYDIINRKRFFDKWGPLENINLQKMYDKVITKES